MACCYRRSLLMQMYPDTEGCKCCHFKLRRDRVRGLPVNSGYAKTRQHLREKLKREKSQAQQQTQQGQAKTAVTVPLTPPDPQPLVHGTQHNTIFPNAVIKQKKPTNETVTTNENPMGSGDVDQLVQLIEGIQVTPAPKPPSEVDPKKAAKKARQKEKKELLKRQEEAEHQAETERLQRIQEEEQRRREEEEREEEARKKREKKKRRKQNKKEAQAAKAEDSEATKEEGNSTQRKSSLAIPTTASENVLHSDPSGTGTPVRKSSEMVTIRRHSTAPDTTVTISVKSETGDEDLLYTLVNGQVLAGKLTKTAVNGSLPTETSNARKEAGCNGTTAVDTAGSKKKKKKKKNAAKTEDTPSECRTPEEESSVEEDATIPPPGAIHYNSDINLIVMNPESREDEFECYNSDDYYYGRKEPGEFEEVVSSRVKRNRNKQVKGEESDLEKTSNGNAEYRSRESTPALANSSGRGGIRRVENGGGKGLRVTDPTKKVAKGQPNPKSALYPYAGPQPPKPSRPSSSTNKYPTGSYASKEENMAPRLIKARQEALLQQKTPVVQHRVAAPSPPNPPPVYRVSPSPTSVPRPQEYSSQVQSTSYATQDIPVQTSSPAQYYSRFTELERASTALQSSVPQTFSRPETFQPAFSAEEKLSRMSFQPSFIGDSGLFSQQQTAGYDTSRAPPEIPEFHKAITRPVTNQSPNLASSADHSTPTGEVASHSKPYVPIEQRRSSWTWFRDPSPETTIPQNYFPTPSYPPTTPAFSPTTQAPLNHYQQVSPVGYQRPQEQIYRPQPVTQPSRAGSSNQQLPSFEASLSSVNMHNISRPEPLHGNTLPFGSHSYDLSASHVAQNDPPNYKDNFSGNRVLVDYGHGSHVPKTDSSAPNTFNYGQSHSTDYDYDARHLNYQKPVEQNSGSSFFAEYNKAQATATTKASYAGFPKYSPTGGASNFDQQRKLPDMGIGSYAGLYDKCYDPTTRALLFGEPNSRQDNMRRELERETQVQAQSQSQAMMYERPLPVRAEGEYQERRAISIETEREIRAHVNEYYPGRDLGPFITMRNRNRDANSSGNGQEEGDPKPPVTNQYSLF